MFSDSDKQSYVVVTPAFNEAGYIEKAAQSLVAQSISPRRWIVVDDGSTDATADIIKQYSCKYSWIEVVMREREPNQTYFASNVYAIMHGVQHLGDLDYDFLGILDADITLPEDYYEQILRRFSVENKLGVASGIYENLIDGKLHKVLNDRRSTPKAIQVFRRECFEQIGGFKPLKYGGEDTCACAKARMQGWKTWSFPDLKVVHHRPTGLGNTRSILKARFIQGLYEFSIGSHPLFVLVKSLRRCVRERPYILSGLARQAGFIFASLCREERQIPMEVVRFIRREQVQRLIFGKRIPKQFRCDLYAQ